ncbi:hypothetical protein STENM327S_06166 [Streptomyces tendae]
MLALAAPLGAALAGAVRAGLREAWTAAGTAGAGDAGGRRVRGPVLLVPVPSARGAVRTRGHDPARRIALAASGELRRTGAPVRALAVLRQRHAVADRSGLDARRRLDNLAGALAVAPGGGGLLRGGGAVVLVDDLMTTGVAGRGRTCGARGDRCQSSGGGVRHVRVGEIGCVSGGRGMQEEGTRSVPPWRRNCSPSSSR